MDVSYYTNEYISIRYNKGYSLSCMYVVLHTCYSGVCRHPKANNQISNHLIRDGYFYMEIILQHFH